MRITAIFSSSFLALLSLGACDMGDEAAPAKELAGEAQQETVTDEVPTVEISRTLGQFDGEVTDLVAIEDTQLGFRSRILAANGEAGVHVIQADGLYEGLVDAVGKAAGAPPAAELAVSYGRIARGDIFQLIPERGGLYTIKRRSSDLADESGRASWQIDRPVIDLCVAGALGLAVTSTGEVFSFEADKNAEGTWPMTAVAGAEGTEGCTEAGAQLLLRRGESLWALGPDGLAETFITGTAEAVAVTTDGPVALSRARGQLMVGGAAVQLVDESGAAITARSIAVAPGNFGGLLRDGAVMVMGEDNRLHLAAWNAVANAAGAPRSLPSIRPDQDQKSSILSVDETLELTPQRPLPGFGPAELPEPPGTPE